MKGEDGRDRREREVWYVQEPDFRPKFSSVFEEILLEE